MNENSYATYLFVKSLQHIIKTEVQRGNSYQVRFPLPQDTRAIYLF